jgi:hypothetical protein
MSLTLIGYYLRVGVHYNLHDNIKMISLFAVIGSNFFTIGPKVLKKIKISKEIHNNFNYIKNKLKNTKKFSSSIKKYNKFSSTIFQRIKFNI